MTKKRKRKTRWYVFVAEVKPASKKKKPASTVGLAGSDDGAALYVGYIRGERPEKRFPGDDFSSAKKGSILEKRGIRILPDFTTKHTSKIGYLGQQQRLIEGLKADGFEVVNRPLAKTHSVYVIKLKSEVAEIPGVKKLNPDRDSSKHCVYVGQTKKEPRITTRGASEWRACWAPSGQEDSDRSHAREIRAPQPDDRA